MDTQEQRIDSMTKEETEIYIGKVVIESILKAMTEYADLRCKPLINALRSAKDVLVLCAAMLDKSSTCSNEVDKIEKALQDYNQHKTIRYDSYDNV